MLLLRIAALFLALAVVKSQNSCAQQSCQCQFSKEGVGGESPKSQSAKKSEILAAAAGVMSPLLIGGAGLGIYKLVKNKGSNNSMGGSVSSLADSTDSQPPQYRPQSRKKDWNF